LTLPAHLLAFFGQFQSSENAKNIENEKISLSEI